MSFTVVLETDGQLLAVHKVRWFAHKHEGWHIKLIDGHERMLRPEWDVILTQSEA